MRSNGLTYTEIYEFIKSKGYIPKISFFLFFALTTIFFFLFFLAQTAIFFFLFFLTPTAIFFFLFFFALTVIFAIIPIMGKFALIPAITVFVYIFIIA